MKTGFYTYCLLFLPLFSFGQETDSLSVAFSSPPPNIKTLSISSDTPDFAAGRYQLRDYLYLLPDPEQQFTFADISSADSAGRFSPFQELAPRLQEQPYYWVRLTIHADLDQPDIWLVNFMMPEIESFTATNNSRIDTIYSGFLLPLSERYYQDRYGHLPLLPIAIPDRGYRNYYWRITTKPFEAETDFGNEWKFFLLAPSFISHYRHAEGFFLALSLGLFLAVGIYHLIIFFYNREISYLWFSLYCLAGFMSASTLSGYALPLFWPEYPDLHYFYLRGITLCLMNLFLVLFTRSYLQTQRLVPLWDKILWIVFGMICVGFTLFGQVSLTNPSLSFMLARLGHLAQILLCITIFVIAVRCMNKGFRPAIIYLFASAAFLAGTILNILNVIQVLPWIPHVSWIQIGRVIQVILFSYGLAQLLKSLLDEKAEARRLKELDTAKTRLYTNITHEFRTPLTIILGMVEQIKDDPGKWYNEGLQMIRRSGANLLQLVNQMLDLSKLESGSVPVRMTQGDIVIYLKYIVESFYALADNHGIHLDFITELDELAMDYDREKILHIVSNLISNAIKFTPEGGKVQLTVTTKDAPGSKSSTEDQYLAGKNCLVLTVSDTGSGIPPEKLTHLFDRFYQGDDSSTRQSEGTGIGLALTRELVKLLRGKIFVESTVGEGTKFTVLLPITNQAPISEETSSLTEEEGIIQLTNIPAEESPSEEVNEPGYPNAQLIVLVIEDNLDVVQYLKTLLTKTYHIEVALNGEEGIEQALEIVPDLIICDVMMPIKDGFEVCELLKTNEQTSHIPIILLTAKADISSRIEGLKRGADAYLAKPFSKQELLVRLEKLMELRKRLQARYSSLTTPPPSNDLAVRLEDDFMEKLRNLLEAHYSEEDFGIPDLYQELNMSRAQMYRKVSALTGKPVAAYLRSFRLLKAKNLLHTTNLTVSEIAFRVGFKDLGHFSRTFRKEFGGSPTELRN